MIRPQVPVRVVLHDPAPPALAWLSASLAQQGHALSRTTALEDLLAAAAASPPPDLVVMRRSGPVRAGLQALRRLREASAIPCILVAWSTDDAAERVAGLQLGADDYLHRGMPQAEILARVQAVLRRANPALAAALPKPVPPLQAAAAALPGGWRLVPQQRALVPQQGAPVKLTGAEFALLRLLAAAGGEPVDREAISRSVFRRPWRVEDRAVDGLVKRLRRKLDEDPIATVRGIGYALLTDAAARATQPESAANAGLGTSRPVAAEVENCGPMHANAATRMHA